ncbi:MAG: alginate lyase family protein [Anaerolineales bacterium]|nr:alginate lyase family protein [Anaerolineales bacterium]
MNPFEVLGIIGIRSAFWYAVYRAELASGIARKRTPLVGWQDLIDRLSEAAADWSPENGPPFFFRGLDGIGEYLRRISPDSAGALAEELAHIRKGSFRLWEDRRHACGFPPEWNRNPLTGRPASAECHWTEVREEAAGDIKGLWELSRFSFAFRLARCYALTGEEQAPETFWRLVESWVGANPPNAGPQWISGQEAALRAMAWTFALHAFADSPATTPERVKMMMAALEAHAARIEATPAYARAQNNNHLLCEAAGLFTIGLMFPALPGASRRRDLGLRLIGEAAGQFFPDGGYIQHSHNYHRFAVQLGLWVLRLGELNDRPIPELLRRGVRRSFDLLRTLTHRKTGRAPNFGHNDGALFLPLNTCEYEDYRPLLQALSLWRDRKKVFRDGPWDEDALWLLGPDSIGGTKRRRPRDVEFEPKPFFAPCAGFYVLEGVESQAVIRCVRFRSRPAHADQLHLDLWWRGENVAADAGTYLYSGESPWRNSLSHAGVHNTATVDGQDQMRRSGRFLWTSLADAVVGMTREGVWCGSHDGYRRRGVIHRRLVEYLDEDIWIVTDDLLGQGAHSVRLHWLIPDYPWEWNAPEKDPALVSALSEKVTGWKDGSGGGIALNTPAGGISLRIWSNRPAVWDLYRAGERMYGPETPDDTVPNAIRGWRSLRYAEKTPALSFAGKIEAELPVRLISVWAPIRRNK